MNQHWPVVYDVMKVLGAPGSDGSYEDLQAPGSYEDLQAPGSYEDLQAPGSYEDLQAPGSDEDLQAPGSDDDLQAPGSCEDLQAPGSDGVVRTSRLQDDLPLHVILLSWRGLYAAY